VSSEGLWVLLEPELVQWFTSVARHHDESFLGLPDCICTQCKVAAAIKIADTLDRDSPRPAIRPGWGNW
jgi:hypothetical protein